ncbi:probable phospholipid hydroperoxide glutathione peroxidase [Agrilus planipennis]|uniref:Glutathione peroxidase n=1 Tax=Agrilus planipennis TaxID=224129 RepID=A0A1W4WMR2_AGRPL|nr:probable phospholipid hydroperoxide glutathione peroxidase [Agrilus planipennis]
MLYHSLSVFLNLTSKLSICPVVKLNTMANEGENWKNAQSVYEFVVNNIKGEPVSLEKYRGNVLIIVNVASRCGYTANHYKELNELYEKFSESKGLKILAFPCNQFAHQEPGGSDEICQFASSKNVKFDLFEKIDVNGANAHPLWKYLKEKQGGILGNFIKWNFTKFVVDRNGQPVERFGPNVSPLQMLQALEKYW